MVNAQHKLIMLCIHHNIASVTILLYITNTVGVNVYVNELFVFVLALR